VRRTLPGPPGLAGEPGGLLLKTAEAAVDSASNLVAVVDDKGSVVVTDLNDGRIVDTRLGSDAVFVAFAGRRLLVQRKGGSLEVWDQRGRTRERLLSGGDTSHGPPVANAQGTMVARRRSNGSVVLADLDSGVMLATVPSDSGSLALKSGMAFTPDGTQLITVTEAAQTGDALLVRRDISDEALVRDRVRNCRARPDPAEWQAFVSTAAPDDLACR
jgi:DNA-binding beta-propeller fold protein YncE